MMWHNRLGLTIAERAPWLVRPALGIAGPVMARLSRVLIANLVRHVTEPDRVTLAQPDFLRILSGTFREAFHQGSPGAVSDALIYGRPWDVDLGSIRIPVHVWHGEEDAVVPVSMARWVARAIPGASATYLPGEGHFSLIARHSGAIFGALGAPCSPS
jgi:pimeloyl-ACP methyl ester carboxylesterase